MIAGGVRKRAVLWIALAVAAFAIAAILFRPGNPQNNSGQGSSRPIGEPAAAPGQPTPAPLSPDLPSQSANPSNPVLAQIHELLAKLQRGQADRADLARLRRALAEGDPQVAISAILAFLATGLDAKTGEEFTIGEGGQLAGAPTLRVLLLDQLGTLSRKTGGGEAAAFARELLDEKNSADEWAIAMRNVAWHEPQAKAFLSEKMRQLLTHEPWRTRPTAGMLEAFDIIVFTRDPTFVPTLADLARTEQTELQYAAEVALDRLSETAPLEVMNHLNANPAVLADRPFLRADYFAKADLAQIPQRHAVENYLSRTDVTGDEKTKLLKGLLTPGTFVSDNLVTEPPAPGDDTARLATLQQTVQQWLDNNRFPQLRPELLQLSGRLNLTTR